VVTNGSKLDLKWIPKNKEEMVENGELKKTPKMSALGENKRHSIIPPTLRTQCEWVPLIGK